MPDELKQIHDQLEKAIEDHPTSTDAWLFNGGTMAVLLLSAIASALAANESWGLAWVAGIFSALSAFLVALERALGFGPRRRFHMEMRAAYRAIQDMIDFYPLLPADKQSQYLEDIWTALRAARIRDAALPNTGGAAPH